MKRLLIICILVFSYHVSNAVAADVKEKYPIAEAMQVEKVKALFDDDIAFYWGAQPHPPVAKKFGSFKTSKRTNGFAKTNENACGWAMASALVALRDRAQKEGANAVINIVSNIKNNEESSETTYSCLAGSIMVNVALKGTVVTLKQ